MSSGVEAVVFDLDGVLVDSEEVWDAARRAVVGEHGGRWRDGATRQMMGMSSHEWSRFLVDELGVALAPEEVDSAVVAALLETYERELPLLPGARAAVLRMAERFPLGLASSSNRPVIDRVLELMEVADRFGATVSSEEVGRGKPAPDVYLEAARRLGVDPRACLAVEDSENGIRSAHGAGMRVVALPDARFAPADDVLALATAVLPDLDALTPEVAV